MAELKELLKTNGDKLNFINPEIAEKLTTVLKEMGFNMIVDEAKNPEYVPKARLDDEIGKKNLLKTQLDDQNKSIDDLKLKAKGNEDLEKQLSDLQQKDADWQNKYNDLSVNTAIALKLTEPGFKAKDKDILMLALDRSKIKLDGNNLLGLDDQLKSLKETKSFLFEDEKTPPAVGGGTNPPGGGNAGGGAQDGLRAALAAQFGV